MLASPPNATSSRPRRKGAGLGHGANVAFGRLAAARPRQPPRGGQAERGAPPKSSADLAHARRACTSGRRACRLASLDLPEAIGIGGQLLLDRKSTRLNSSHLGISYAVFC